MNQLQTAISVCCLFVLLMPSTGAVDCLKGSACDGKVGTVNASCEIAGDRYCCKDDDIEVHARGTKTELALCECSSKSFKCFVKDDDNNLANYVSSCSAWMTCAVALLVVAMVSKAS
ncbi:hypothetical protein V1264_000296 [Littorina saxatilis]|uniref:Uncharacterized protein n=1 Tax=Littorina saxatilis TaxID=31220 RepID=A0AAN9GNC2_9CAEN